MANTHTLLARRFASGNASAQSPGRTAGGPKACAAPSMTNTRLATSSTRAFRLWRPGGRWHTYTCAPRIFTQYDYTTFQYWREIRPRRPGDDAPDSRPRRNLPGCHRRLQTCFPAPNNTTPCVRTVAQKPLSCNRHGQRPAALCSQPGERDESWARQSRPHTPTNATQGDKSIGTRPHVQHYWSMADEEAAEVIRCVSTSVTNCQPKRTSGNATKLVRRWANGP